MFRIGNSSTLRRIAGLVIGLCLALGFSGPTQAGPFERYAGVWGGGGVVTYEDGTEEPIQCRVQYVVPDENNLQQALRCSTGGHVYQVNAIFLYRGETISGRWWELSYDITGRLSGSADMDGIDGALHALGHTADLTVSMTDKRQKIRIVTTDLEVRQVDVEVQRSTR